MGGIGGQVLSGDKPYSGDRWGSERKLHAEGHISAGSKMRDFSLAEERVVVGPEGDIEGVEYFGWREGDA